MYFLRLKSNIEATFGQHYTKLLFFPPQKDTFIAAANRPYGLPASTYNIHFHATSYCTPK